MYIYLDRHFFKKHLSLKIPANVFLVTEILPQTKKERKICPELPFTKHYSRFPTK